MLTQQNNVLIHSYSVLITIQQNDFNQRNQTPVLTNISCTSWSA